MLDGNCHAPISAMYLMCSINPPDGPHHLHTAMYM